MIYETVRIHRLPLVINHVASAGTRDGRMQLATSNPDKAAEFSRILGIPIESVDLHLPPEIQSAEVVKVVKDKAIKAWESNDRRPILVEDSALQVMAMDGRLGALVKFWDAPEARRDICSLIGQKGENRAVAQVAIGLFDGTQVFTWLGETPGIIAAAPRGVNGFDWDDIFIPDDQEDGAERTFAEMTAEEKDTYSMRRRALEDYLAHPPDIRQPVFGLPETYKFQLDFISPELLQYLPALKYAVSLRAMEGLRLENGQIVGELKPVVVEEWAPGFFRYTADPESPDLGLLITPMDTAIDIHNNPYRLAVDGNERPVLWQMGPDSIKMAISARTLEFQTFHNETMYQYLRDMRGGKFPHVERANVKSEVIEDLIRLLRSKEKTEEGIAGSEGDGAETESIEKVMAAAASMEFGYTRMSADERVTRSIVQGLITTASGIPSSVFGLGGMPPVSGFKDTVVTAAMAYSDVYIPRNSIFIDPDRRTRLFQESRDQIRDFGLPSDIEDLVIRHIGVALGTDNINDSLELAQRMYQDGCRLFRIYSTNPGPDVIELAKELRLRFGDDIRICVGPVVDMKQAKTLVQDDIKANILLAGHGGGENCTSLEGGAASNTLELAYLMSIDPEFNKTAIGLEGGTGIQIGQLLPWIDVISLNRRGIAAGIEAGNLCVEHSNNRVVMPYSGSASANTQWWEVIAASKKPELSYVMDRRVNPDGRLRVVEGKIGYMIHPRGMPSMVDALNYARILAGRTIADQNSQSLGQLRERYNQGELGQRIISPGAEFIAAPHQGRNG